jgi:hypothetical protein
MSQPALIPASSRSQASARLTHRRECVNQYDEQTKASSGVLADPPVRSPACGAGHGFALQMSNLGD